MKKGFTRTTVGSDNLKTAKELAGVQDGLDAYYGLIAVLADACDLAASGGDVWCTVGLARDKGALLLTVNMGQSKLYASGATLDDLAAAAQELLD